MNLSSIGWAFGISVWAEADNNVTVERLMASTATLPR